MTYWALNAVFLGVVIAVAMVAIASHRAPRWGSVLLACGILVLVTALFDNVLIAVDLIAYAPAKISGVVIGRAPVEDFAYAVAAVVLLPSLWTLVGHRREDA